MKTSVIIPCHNAEAWVGDSLRSVLGQWKPPDQILVVNDASTDHSAEVVRSFGGAVTLLNTSVGNAAAARNVGIREAQGDLIAFLDADDVWYPWHLEAMCELFSEGTDAAAMSLRDTVWTDGRQDQMRSKWGIEQPCRGLTESDCYRFWCIEPWWNTIITVARHERLNEIGGFDESQRGGQDLDLWLRLIADNTWSFLPRATARRRGDTPDSVSRTSRVRQIYYTFRAFLLNRPSPANLDYDCLLRQYARSVVSISLQRPHEENSAEYRQAAWPHLSPRDRLIMSGGRRFPTGYRFLHRLRQTLGG